jgi:hypothetical protein
MRHVFADESKHGNYLFGVASFAVGDMAEARKALRAMVMPGQRSLHFGNESDKRRHHLIGQILRLEVEVAIIDTCEQDAKHGRAKGLEELVRLSVNQNAVMLVVERDETTYLADTQLLRKLISEVGDDVLRFGVIPRHEEPLLWVSDAIAWCYQRGGIFRRKLIESGLSVTRN